MTENYSTKRGLTSQGCCWDRRSTYASNVRDDVKLVNRGN